VDISFPAFVDELCKIAASHRHAARFMREEKKVRERDKKLWKDVEGLPVGQVQVAPLYKKYRKKKVWGRRTMSPDDLASGKGSPFRRYQHTRLLQEADTSYPIIMRPNGRILDGVHRLVKAKQEGVKTLPAVVLPD